MDKKYMARIGYAEFSTPNAFTTSGEWFNSIEECLKWIGGRIGMEVFVDKDKIVLGENYYWDTYTIYINEYTPLWDVLSDEGKNKLKAKMLGAGE